MADTCVGIFTIVLRNSHLTNQGILFPRPAPADSLYEAIAQALAALNGALRSALRPFPAWRPAVSERWRLTS